MKPIHMIVLLAALAAAGCSIRGGQGADRPAARVVTPADFVAQPGETPAQPVRRTPTVAAQPAPTPTPTAIAPPIGDNRAYAIDAMVGQVNGRAIYASEVFKDVHEQLVARGKAVPRARFEREVTGIIAQRLQVIVLESLILGEAERDLTQQQQQGLVVMLKRYREDLIKRFGEGAASLAEMRITQQQGQTLDQAVEDYRQEVLVKRYLDQHVLPKINVSRRDIERYYQRHYDDFNPPPSRTIYMIRTNEEGIADLIDQKLNQGTPFLEIAGNADLNRYKAADKGLFGEDLPGNNVFGPDELNEPTIALSEGSYTGRITLRGGFYWIYVSRITRETPRPLREVQTEIESLLRRQQYEQLTAEYHQELFEKGSYDPLDEMVDRLVEVAMARYAQPLPQTRSDSTSSR